MSANSNRSDTWDIIRLSLQQVMTQPSSVWSLNEESKLGGPNDFYKWQCALTMKLRTKGLYLYEYMVDGSLPPSDDRMVTEEMDREMRNLLSACVTAALFASVKGDALMLVQNHSIQANFTLSGSDLFHLLCEQYGKVSFSMVWKRVFAINQKGFGKSRC